ALLPRRPVTGASATGPRRTTLQRRVAAPGGAGRRAAIGERRHLPGRRGGGRRARLGDPRAPPADRGLPGQRHPGPRHSRRRAALPPSGRGAHPGPAAAPSGRDGPSRSGARHRPRRPDGLRPHEPPRPDREDRGRRPPGDRRRAPAGAHDHVPPLRRHRTAGSESEQGAQAQEVAMQYTQRNPLPMPPGGAYEPIKATIDSVFDWQYALRQQNLLNLYEEGKTLAWNANDLDWSIDVDIERLVRQRVANGLAPMINSMLRP